jgi:putative hemolysin
VLKLLENPESFIATLQVGITFVTVLASAIGGAAAIEYLDPIIDNIHNPTIQRISEVLAIGTVVVIVSYLSLVFGELAPKSLALHHAERIALFVGRPVQWLQSVLSIFVRFLTFTTNLLLRPFKDSTSFTESRISEEEIKFMLEEGAKSGTIEKQEKELIQSIFEFSDTTAREVMVPRTDMVAIDMDAPREKLVKIVIEEGYSRMPVYRGNIDNIIGIIYSKDLIGLFEHRDLIALQDVIRPAYFVPETKKISQLLRELQAKKIHLAIVIDEFGGTEGIITMEDILEEIVGEIRDEYDDEAKDVEQTAEGMTLVNAMIHVADFNEYFHSDIPETENYDTLGGFLVEVTGRIPAMHEKINYGEFQFAVTKRSDRRVRQVKLIRMKRTEFPSTK